MSIPNPTAIPTTLVGTSSPLDLSKGISLFSDNPPIPLGVTYNGTFFSDKKKALGFEVEAESGYSLNAGASGPAWATVMTVSGNFGASDQAGVGEVDLVISNDQTQAGFIMGLELGLFFKFKLKTWVHDAEVDFTPTFDIIEIALYLIQLALGPNHFLTQLDNVLPSVQASWGAFDTGSNYVPNNGVITASPVFTLPINVWNLLVDIDEASGTFGGALVAANKLLSATKSSFVVGPTIGLGVTTTITMESITLDDVTVPIVSFDQPSGSAIGQTSTALPTAPTEIGFGFKQVPTFDLSLGLTASVSFFQVINLGASYSIDVLGFLNLPVNLGTYHPSISNKIGATGANQTAFYEIELA